MKNAFQVKKELKVLSWAQKGVGKYTATHWEMFVFGGLTYWDILPQYCHLSTL